MIYKKFYDLTEVKQLTGVEPVALAQNFQDFELYVYFSHKVIGQRHDKAVAEVRETIKNVANQYISLYAENPENIENKDEALEWIREKTVSSLENAEIIPETTKDTVTPTLSNTAKGYEQIWFCEGLEDMAIVKGFKSIWGAFLIDDYHVSYTHVFVKHEELERIKDLVSENKSTAQRVASNQEHGPEPKAKNLSINETRKLAFKFWVAGNGGPESVENMTKRDVWQELQKVDAKLFANGFDALFEDSKTKQNLVKFKTGRRK
ncbi:MAG: hypothetical protein RI556_11240 [Hydrogenovibrio sp.]|uniref:hypothetical protein n=1 Tax=Hydrogenovibrio sp. TaxID=2065821 RepID=UPI0028701EDB|nr:hypothetical protein [Hydrogenovibrio sp.]MDR9499740.1 hypothetical protein [Hydrogenovibrio sp.]